MSHRFSNRSRERRGGQAGSIALAALVLLGFIAVLTLALAAASLTQVQIAKSGQDRLIGTTLAEAGVDAAIDQLTADYSTTSVTGTLYEDTAQTKSLGTYTVAISDVDVALGKKKAISVATPRNGKSRTVIALITQGTMQLGNAAMIANGPINLGGGANIATTPALGHVADVYGNGNVTLGGTGYTDGRLISAGAVTGTAFYPSVSNAPKMPFPSASTVLQMQADWITKSKATSNTYTASSLFPGNKSSVTVTAPAYINGNLQMTSGQTLTLTGDGVVYINGNLKTVAGSTIINGSTLVVGGSLDQQGQSSYQVSFTSTTVGGPASPTLAVVGGDVTLAGGSANVQWGIIYAVNGGIKVNGNATYTGALVAGGLGSTITATGTYNQYFPINMASTVRFPSNPVVTHIIEM